MRILHTVESYLPLKHGMSEVVRQVSERLVKAGHDVTVATSFCINRSDDKINGVKIISFHIKGNYVNGYEGEVEAYRAYLHNVEFDIITNFAGQQWATDICIEILPNLKAKKVFVPTGFSALTDPAYSSYFEMMKLWMNEFDMNVFLSDDYRDINFARSNKIKNIKIIPNGAAKDEFLSVNTEFSIRKKLNIPANHKLILHVGSYTGLKGHEEALEIFLKSHINHASLVFIGTNFKQEGRFFDEKLNWFKNLILFDKINKRSIKSLLYFLGKLANKPHKNVFTVSLNRAETIASYQQADLFLFPSMIECSPIVLFEALASKTPFLVTDVGNAAEIIQWTQGGALLPTNIDDKCLSHADIQPSSIILNQFINDTDKLERMKHYGHTNWLRDFTWEKIANQYEEMYINLLN